MKLLAAFLVLFLVVDAKPKKRYSITEGTIGDLKTMTISNTRTDEMVEIVTDFGGRVEKLMLAPREQRRHRHRHQEEELRDVLLGHNNDADAIKENGLWKGMLLLPYANRIAYGKYSFFNDSYTLPLNENSDGRENAMHGFMAGKQLDILSTETSDKSGILTTNVTIENEPGYPFKLEVIITYKLDDRGFTISVEVTNRNGDGTPLPFYMGWHPYFKCTAYTSTVTLDPCTKWAHVEMNTNLNPTGLTEPTNAFDGSSPIGGSEANPTFYDDEYKPLSNCNGGQVTLFDRESGQTPVLWYDGAFNYVQMFTGASSLAHEDAVAMEPMSAMADAYNNHDGLTVLSDQETWSGSFGVYVTSD